MADPAGAGRVSGGSSEAALPVSGKQPTPPADQLQRFNPVVPRFKRLARAVPAPFGISLLAVATVDR